MSILAESAALRFGGADAPGPLAPEVVGTLLVPAVVWLIVVEPFVFPPPADVVGTAPEVDGKLPAALVGSDMVVLVVAQ